jgi:hypothetical protein
MRGASKKLRKYMTAAVAVITFTGLLLTTTTLVARAADGPIFTVMNTSETLPDGVWFRYEPYTADTNRITGLGVYKNERVQLECYAFGQAVGPYNDRLWYWSLNVTRPVNDGIANQGYLNAHFINDGKAANQVDAGVPACGAQPPPSSPGPKSVFYSPNNTPDAVANLQVADLNLPLSEWATGSQCSTGGAVNIPSGVSILAGWSLGRLGPIYFLDAAGAHRVSQIHAIILFDPGSTSDFAEPPLWKRLLGDQTCDWQYPINSLLANWLKSNSSNRLIVLTGADSEMKNGSGKSTFAGLWKYYFAGIWNQPFAGQALVCDYNKLGHQAVLTDFAAGLLDKTPAKCPTASSAPTPTSWHP